MKVLLFTRPGIGGAATVVESLVRFLPREGVDLTVLCSPLEDPAYPDRLASYGVPVRVVRVEREPAPLSDVAVYATLAGMLREGRFDVLHLHTTKPGLIGRMVSPRVSPSTKVVYTPHGFYFQYAPSPAKRSFYLEMERALGAETDLLVACSHVEGELAVSAGVVPREKVVVVPNGVDLEACRSAEDPAETRRRFGFAEGDVVVSMAARMAAPKDPVCVVRAAARLAPRQPRLRVLLVGDGPLRADAETEAARLGVGGVVRFHGAVRPLAPIYAMSAATVLSTSSEGLPMVVLESLACGVPVVASDIPGCCEVVEDGVTGFVFPSGSDDALAAAIDRLLSDEGLRAAIGEAGRKRVEERHDARAGARRVAEAYCRLAEGAIDK
ncbi:MAG: glycosyltransferase family 4 protein [Planctomycetota bacterium]